MILDTNGIQKILPHRYPFLMVDAILEMERFKRIVGVKNVSINESFFQGHFPGKPILPGVLIIEAMAQTGGLLLLQEVPDRENKLLYFVAVDFAVAPVDPFFNANRPEDLADFIGSALRRETGWRQRQPGAMK